MKKIKGSLSAIRMSHLVVLFAVTAISALAIRTYQLLVMVNPQNGFFENADFTVGVLYGLLVIATVLFLILSFLSKNVPAPKLPEGRNIPLAIASFIAAAGFAYDVVAIAMDIIPEMGIGMNNTVFSGLLTNYVKANGGIFVVLELVFALISALYLLVFGTSHFEGVATYKKLSLLSIAPGCWAMFVLISKLMKAISFITVSELLFEIAMLVFTMLFFLTFARIVSGVYSVNSMWCTYGCGFPAAVFAGLISVPRGIVLLGGGQNVVDSEFSFTHLLLFVFIVVYIISTMGVGFKNSIKKMRSVSNIVLPDDAEVVVKSSEDAPVIAEEDVVEQVEENEKKKRFSIAPEFKNLEDITDFFDDESDEICVEETEVTEAESFQDVEPLVEETLLWDEAEYEAEPEAANEEPVVEELTEEIAEPSVEEFIEEFPKPVAEEISEDILEYETELPVEDVSFYRIEAADIEEKEITVAEAVEDYEEVSEKEDYQVGDEVDSPIDDIIPAEEDSQEISYESPEKVEKISVDADGKVAFEEGSEEVPEEITEESTEEVISDEDDFDFELMDIFGEKSEEIPLAEEPLEAISEADSKEIIEEIIESIGVSEIFEEKIEIIDDVQTEEVIEEPAEAEPVTEEASPYKSSGGFLEFSQMLIDADDEDLTASAEEKVEETKPVEEIPMPQATEKSKPEKVKKEKVKKEKVKKEKAPKAPKLRGKKKSAEDDEPLTIVSLADLRQKKDEE